MDMTKEKTPGCDGIPDEFYQLFWDEIQPVFVNFVQHCFEEEKILPENTNTGILNLIPKNRRDQRYLKNLRPITLLNVDYKIIEKALANRLDNVLPQIINNDQTGFMKGRRISTNIRKVMDIIQHCKNTETAAVLLNLDYIKCFDKIAFDCILGSLNYFAFPPYIIEWIRILYTGFRIKVQNNGYFTQTIEVQKSVHQGGCISVQLFLLCAEVVALELRNNAQIRGIIIQDLEYLLSQYADDMNVASEYEENSISNIFKCLDWFRGNSGFSLSYEKTTMYRMGSIHNTEAKYYTEAGVVWSNEPINVLGVRIGVEDNILELNYDNLVKKTRDTLNAWENRGLCLHGKVCVINTLIASQFVYKMLVLPEIPNHIVQKIENLFVDYLWSNKKPKIPLRYLQLNKKCGGLGLVSLKKRDQALKTSWIGILAKDSKAAHLAYSFFSPVLKQDIWKCNFKDSQVDQFFSKEDNPFWYDVLRAWACINYQKDPAKSCYYLWLNDHVRIDNKMLLNHGAFRKGLLEAQQLYQGGAPISWIKAHQDFGLTLMEYNSIITALPKCWKKAIKHSQNCQQNYLYCALINKAKISSTVYKQLTTDETAFGQKVDIWSTELSY